MSRFAIVQKSILISNKMLYPKTTCMRSITGFIQKIATIFHGLLKDFSRAILDFQGPPTRNIISQTVHKCTFPVYSNKALRLELCSSPTSLHFSVHLS